MGSRLGEIGATPVKPWHAPAWLFTSLAVLIAGQARAPGQGNIYPYSAAFYSAGAAPGAPHLSIFPTNGRAFGIALPFVFGAFTFDPDGRKIYVAPLRAFQQTLRGLFVIEFNPLRATQVRGSESLVAVSVSVSGRSGKILVTGSRLLAGSNEWGIFEIDPDSGDVRTVVRQEAPRPGVNGEVWAEISVSPDGARAVAFRRKELDLIDLLKGIVTPLGPDLEQGSWSPDGKWLAVNDRKKVRTVLLDASTLIPRRTFEWSHLRWSPDSRYLLGVAAHDGCGPDFATLQAISVETGAPTRISTSECMIDSVTTGWLASDISY